MWLLLLGLTCHLAAALLYPYRDSAPLFLMMVALCFGFQLLARRSLRRRIWPAAWFWVACLAIRLVWIAHPPGLSEDVYRYLWDGSLGAEGHNAYLQEPRDDLEARGMRPDLYSRMAHVDRTSIYPPAAQFLFAGVVALAGTSAVAWKLLLLAFEFLLVLCWRAAGRRRLSALSLWLLHPLVVIEFYSSGHLDLVAIVFMIGAAVALALSRRSARTFMAGSLWALGVLTKVFPLFALPALVRLIGSTRLIALSAGAFATLAAVPLGYAAVWGHPRESWASWLGIMNVYQDIWRFNSLPYFVFPEWRREILWGAQALLALTAVYLLRTWRPRRTLPAALPGRLREVRNLASGATLLFAVLYSGAHTLHPWYATWGLAWLPLADRRLMAVRYLAAACLASYLFYGLSPPGDRLWLLLVEWIPFYFLLVLDLRRVRLDRTRPSGSEKAAPAA